MTRVANATKVRAYPKLVEALKLARADLDAVYGLLSDGRTPVVSIGAFKRRDAIKTLLLDLGEEA